MPLYLQAKPYNNNPMEPQSYFATRFSKEQARDAIWRHITNYLIPYWNLPANGNSKVLELGTGYGSWIRAVPSKSRQALDLHPDVAQIFKEAGIDNVKTHVGSCIDLSRFPGG